MSNIECPHCHCRMAVQEPDGSIRLWVKGGKGYRFAPGSRLMSFYCSECRKWADVPVSNTKSEYLADVRGVAT